MVRLAWVAAEYAGAEQLVHTAFPIHLEELPAGRFFAQPRVQSVRNLVTAIDPRLGER